MKYISIIAIILVICAFGTLLTNAKCPTPNVVKNFNVTAYLGKWYEIAVSPLVRETFEFDCDCTSPIYSIEQPKPLLIKVNNTCRRGGVDAPLSVAVGVAKPTTNPAKLEVSFYDSPYAPYWVLSVGPNYEWATIYSCEEFIFDFESVWLIARDPLLAQHNKPLVATILRDLEKQTGYNTSEMHFTTQQGCP